MSEQAEIEDWAIFEFSTLTDYGFSEPLIKRERSRTVVDWLGAQIALELELDWKEFDVFFLVVILENNQLPNGYYVSHGKPCRFHIQKVIKEHRWSVAVEEMKVISSNSNRGPSRKPTVENLKKRVLAYKAVVMSCIRHLHPDSQALILKKSAT